MSGNEALPGMEDDTPPADDFIRKLLENALIANDKGKLPEIEAVRACKTNAEVAALYAPWNADTYMFLFHASVAHMLIRIRESFPNLAASLAHEVESYLDDGGAYSEWVWDWSVTAGIDPQKTIDEARARQAEWLAAERKTSP